MPRPFRMPQHVAKLDLGRMAVRRGHELAGGSSLRTLEPHRICPSSTSKQGGYLFKSTALVRLQKAARRNAKMVYDPSSTLPAFLHNGSRAVVFASCFVQLFRSP
ncbi:hypothetical protein GQ602_002227 [Ophiocordyceps camponoti-floridani]|uniref:Uncharacterized protein n=1 Tax=Ophiocordyceps camponoti-floridani TaxID=2030778 RepID=A0A8H4VFC6_9HYPO|nr:hypothetical protein GQ602_002227 [Ophiocordyceps camponoti-floridani]